jgi:hypothetical protein
MTKRLQVLMDETEFREIRRIARRRRTTVAEWVRQALRAAQQRESSGDAGRKLAAVQTAARHSFPSGNIREMLAEIERGYAGEMDR